MNNEKFADLRNQILNKIANLEDTAATARVTVKESSEVHPNFLQDQSDAAKGEIDLGNALVLHDHCKGQQKLLANALLRMDRGEFGVCLNCGLDIGLRRLEVQPGATCCIHCQENFELKVVAKPRLSNFASHILNRWVA